MKTYAHQTPGFIHLIQAGSAKEALIKSLTEDLRDHPMFCTVDGLQAHCKEQGIESVNMLPDARAVN